MLMHKKEAHKYVCITQSLIRITMDFFVLLQIKNPFFKLSYDLDIKHLEVCK